MSAQPPIAPETDDWLTPGRFAALLAVLVLTLYPPVLLGMQTFVYRDFGYFSYPIAFHLRDSLRHGEFPLWNPLNNCGIPFLAQWNTQTLYPPALFYVIFPLTWALPVFCLLHLYFGGLGMYFLARRWTGNSFAAAVAGVVFAFNGLMLNSLMWPAFIPGFGWMPWVVLLTERAWREGGRHVILAALAGAMQMLSGAVEAILLTWVLLGVMCLSDALGSGSGFVRTLWRGALVVALVTALSAAQLLPFLDFVGLSQRQEGFDGANWPMPGTGWANFLVPFFLSHRSFHGPFVQVNQYWTFSYYAGVLTVALSAWLLWRSRDRRVWSLVGLMTVCLVLALGEATPVYRWVETHISVIALMRFPVKFVIVPVFILPLLAAMALTRQAGQRTDRPWWVIVAIILAATLFLSWLGWVWNDKPDDAVTSAQNGLERAAEFCGLVGLLYWMGRATELKLRRLLQLSVVMLAWLDVAHHQLHPETVRPVTYQPELPREFAAPRFGESRAMISHEAIWEFSKSVIPESYKDYISRRYALFCNCNLIEGIPKTDGFFPLHLRDHKKFAELLYDTDAPQPTPGPLLDFLNVSEITKEKEVFDWTARTNYLPLITAGQRPVFAAEIPTMTLLLSTNFEPRAEVYLRREDMNSVTATNRVPVKLKDMHFAANHIEADVSAAAPALVVVAQTYHHNWHAYVDGRGVPIWRANVAFQAFQIPAGEHAVRLVYEDGQFKHGVILSLATLLGCVVSWFTLARHKPVKD